MPSRVVCHLRSGKTVGKEVADPIWGSPDRPFTDIDLLAKCRALIGPSWGDSKTKRLIDDLLNLDRVADLTTIIPA